MKRIFCFLLCIAMMLTIAACKPDNITYPVEIVDPNDTAQDTTQPEQPEDVAGGEDSAESETPVENQPTEEETADEEEPTDEVADSPAEETPENEEPPAEEPAEESSDDAAKDAEQPTEQAAPINPLAAEDFAPSTTVAGTLQASGIVKPGAAVSALKNRTITLYTADNKAAFSYTDKNGNPVSEWDWMEKLAEENGFLLKRQVKNNSVSLKSQRIALFAGQKLSLVQIAANELGNGMTLATSASDLLNTDAASFGVSKTILKQSDYKLFAPIGNVETLWYNPANLPEGISPQTKILENKWTVSEFNALCNKSQSPQRLEMNNLLPWATLSGRSPLTLLDGKLDSNLYAGVTREAWTSVKALNLAVLTTPQSTAEHSSPLLQYTMEPANDSNEALQYAPLPTLKEGEKGTITFAGTFFALPKYETDTETLRAALTFAELWCNRYTEARAATLQGLGIKGANYQAYCDMAENQGVLILYTPEIQKAAEAYLSGLTDPTVDMDAAYADARSAIEGLIAARNLYY